MSAASDLDAGRYLTACKEMLRERGVTYAMLAAGLGCSLPTVKRVLNKSSVPFNRLLELCRIAEISFADLHERAERKKPTHFVFTDDQDRLFAAREEMLHYFVALAVERRTPRQIAARHGLDRRSTDLYLTHLEAVGVIERRGVDRIRLLVEPPFGFGPGSRVLRREHERFLRTIASEVLAGGPKADGSFLVLKRLRLTAEEYLELVGAMKDVIDRFAAIGDGGPGNVEVGAAWQLAIAAGGARDVPAPPLPRLEG